MVNCSGSAIAFGSVEDKYDALIQAWYPGQGGAKALADVIFGDYNHSGKLPVTFYANTDDLPDFRDYSMKNRTYRYFEGTPLYPFGYGLTYGKCVAKAMKVETLTKDGEFDGANVEVTVVNEGSVATDDVVQIYIKDTGFDLAIPHPSLAGFERVNLKAGEEKKVIVRVAAKAFTSVDNEGERKLFSHSFKIYAGFNQPDKRSEELTGVKCVAEDVQI